MGLIRKTLSISTLGIVSWRSKKELLREAEQDLAQTKADLERTSKIEALLRDKLDDAERRATSAELTALRDARRARRRGARSARADFPTSRRLASAARSSVTPLIGQTRAAAERFLTDAEPIVDSAVDEARSRGRRARKRIAKETKRAEKKARARAEKVKDRTVDLRDKAGEAASGAAENISERAENLTSS